MRRMPVLLLILCCAGCVVSRRAFDGLRGEKALLEAKNADLVREHEKLAAEKAAVDAELARCEREAAAHERRANDLGETNLELGGELEGERARAAGLEAQLQERGGSLAEAVEKARSLERKLEQIENERAVVQRQYQALLERHAQLQRRSGEPERSAPPTPPSAEGGAGAKQEESGLEVSGGE